MRGHWGFVSHNLKHSTGALVRRRGRDGRRHVRRGGYRIPFNRCRKRREPTWYGTLLGLALPGVLVLLVFGAYLTPHNKFASVGLLGGIMISMALIARAISTRGSLACRVLGAAVCAIYPALFLWRVL